MTRRIATVALIALALVLAIMLLARSCLPTDTTVTAIAVGDMACDPADPQFNNGDGTAAGCRAGAVSDAAVALQPDALLGLGDYQYEVPAAASYDTTYNDSWGRLRDVTIPALGNQELKVHDANTFRNYFGDRAGPAMSYWAIDLGSWRVVVLNSNCTTVVGGCAEGSPQHDWLADELRRHPARCTLAMWHHPRWSNGIAGADQRTADLVRLLTANGVDIGLSGHEADYERFTPLDGEGKPDPAGIRTFVVGTGGQAVYQPAVGEAAWRSRQTSAGSLHFDGQHHGFLELRLSPGGYRWNFHALQPDGAARVTDSGSGDCS